VAVALLGAPIFFISGAIPGALIGDQLSQGPD
jgi:hypothetical protein